MARFDEIELNPPASVQPVPPRPAEVQHAPRFRRLLSLLTDLSLFVALALALSPLLPPSMNRKAAGALGGFIVIVSYYYFAGSWWLWGKTIGGAIFDVRVVGAGSASIPLRDASLRWAGLCLSLLTGGIGFMLAALPSRRSLADRVSRTISISSA